MEELAIEAGVLMIHFNRRKRFLEDAYVVSFFVQLLCLGFAAVGCVVLDQRSIGRPMFDGLSTSLLVGGVVGNILCVVVRVLIKRWFDRQSPIPQKPEQESGD